MSQMLLHFGAWYVVLTLAALATAPLARRLFQTLPGGGLIFARPLGILLVGYLFWLGFSLGILSNDAGGAWLALIGVAAFSLFAGRAHLKQWRAQDLRTLLLTEGIFLLAFAAWAVVRAHDPSASHTEKPMDLMYMSSLWASPAYPPQDAWLSGYPIAYYYFGYWLLVTMGRLAGTPPEIAFNVGQAAWYGLLLSGAFALGVTLLRLPFSRVTGALSTRAAWLGGLLAMLAVGVAGNVQSILEWLHAQGVNVRALANWAQVRGFPENARITQHWAIAPGEWWWWRSSRVLADASLRGEHQEVIAEFPAFSYVLGDNHPHVLGMPFVLLALALILVWYVRAVAHSAPRGKVIISSADMSSEEAERFAARVAAARHAPDALWRGLVPADWLLFGVTTLTVGALLALNTWDFPPYLLLFGLVIYSTTQARRLARAFAGAGWLLAGALLLFLPYFLTAQSQASGFNINFFNPTRLPQFLWVLLPFLLGVLTLYILLWREQPPRWLHLVALLLLTIGLPLAFIALTWQITAGNARLFAQLQEWMPLPEGATDYLPLILGRWQVGIWTLVLVAALVAVGGALWLRRLAPDHADATPAAEKPRGMATFVLLLAGVGLLLTYAPEFIFLRDNFGWRMNTIFKFYYQAWLLLGMVSAYAITHAFAQVRRAPIAALVAAPALLLILAATIFTPAGAYSKTNGFAGTPTFDATAWLAPDQRDAARWLRDNAPRAAVVLEAVGGSYAADESIMSTLAGRPTLMGWEGHERQWRGDAFNQMAAGRNQAIETIYGASSAAQIHAALQQWQIDYVVVGPNERRIYQLSDLELARIADAMQLVYASGDVAIYAAR